MIDKLPHQALWTLSKLNTAGYEAFLVGGCVRDLLMGREPGDYDITTSALPEQVEAVFAGERLIETGLKHGTVTLLREGLPLEITTYRRDLSYSDHRHPDAVAFTPRLEEDLARRDFTVNAMAFHPDRGLVDLFGGRADIESRVIRCVGEPERRFDEDALRILRALRFAAQLDFTVDPDTAAAALALRETLDLVSRERIAAELTKLLCGPAVERVVTDSWRILAVPLPELGPMAGFDQRSKYHCYDVLTHCAVACAAAPPDRLTRWAALLHDVGKPACFTLDEAGGGHFYGHAKVSARLTEEALTRLRFDKDTVRRVTRLVEMHDVPIDPPVDTLGAAGNRQQATGNGSSVGSDAHIAPVIAAGNDAASSKRPEASGDASLQGNRQQATGNGSSVGSELEESRMYAHIAPVIAAGNDAASSKRPEASGDASLQGNVQQATGSSAERAVKRLLNRLGTEDFFRLLDVKRGDALAHAPEYRGRLQACDRMEVLARELLARQACFSLKDLAVNGRDLLELGCPRGPAVGRLLNTLLEAVLNGEAENRRETLLALARETLRAGSEYIP